MAHHSRSADPVRPALRRAAAASLVGLLAAACSPIKSTHGVFISQDKLEAIEPGETRRAEVRDSLGTPSTRAPFKGGIWYYIGQQRRRIAFLAPEITKRQVVAITFTEADVVKQVARIDLSDGKELVYVDDKTPTAGHDMTILKQLLGNLGRFSGQEKKRGRGGR